eukprot:scaffold222_cov175-Amphora_coffeaeformis.AAC.6
MVLTSTTIDRCCAKNHNVEIGSVEKAVTVDLEEKGLATTVMCDPLRRRPAILFICIGWPGDIRGCRSLAVDLSKRNHELYY